MCGIVGMVAQEPVNQRLYDALTVLQHRGQDAAGIVTWDSGKFNLRKGNGLVRDVFEQRHMQRLEGLMGIGHCRYPTAGCSSTAEAQPFYVNSPYGIALAHNGNLTNTDALREDLYRTDLRHLNTSSDSEVLLNVLAHELSVQKKLNPQPEDFFAAVTQTNARIRGAYAVVTLISGCGMLAFRDPHGIRPLVLGRKERGMFGADWMVASESVAIVTQGYQVVRDVAPGEAIYVDMQGEMHSRICAPKTQLTPCIFEHVYLARPDSVMDGISVHHARVQMGRKLAEKIKRERPDHGIDAVVPIPDSGRTSAIELSRALGVELSEGFVKNRYIGRTFIMPGQHLRKKSVRQKLNAVDGEFKDRVVLLVDDSIVRGTTCKQIIQMAREAGAKKVYFASAAPAVKYPNVYGIDMPAAEELVAHGRSTEEVCKTIGADWLIYQDLTDLIDAVKPESGRIRQFECSVFDGHYVTRDVDAAYFQKLQSNRNDSAKAAREYSKRAALEREAGMDANMDAGDGRTDSVAGLELHSE